MSAFKCSECRTVINIPNRKWKRRKRNHIKTMWCWKCKGHTPYTLLG